MENLKLFLAASVHPSCTCKELAETIHDRAVLLDALKVAQVRIFMLEGASDAYMKIEAIIDKFEPRAALEKKS